MSGKEDLTGLDAELGDKFKRAAAVAAGMPAALQEIAFNRALDALLGGANAGSTKRGHEDNGVERGREPQGGGANEKKADDPVGELLAMPRSKAEQVDDEDGALGKALALLHVAESELAVVGLSAPQIASVLTTKFKWKVTRQAITQALDRSGKMVDSASNFGARTYTIMDAGIRYLETPRDQRQAPSGAGTRRHAQAGASSNTAGTTSDAESLDGNSKKARRKTGPREAVEQLIASSFFSQPRMLGSIRQELRDTRGLSYKASDLSPTMTRLLREGELTRSKNQEGQYEYISS